MQKFFNAAGTGRYFNKSETWGRYSFASGKIPTEAIINGREPVVSAETLKKLAPKLRKRASPLN
jgi:hypothetical protein